MTGTTRRREGRRETRSLDRPKDCQNGRKTEQSDPGVDCQAASTPETGRNQLQKEDGNHALAGYQRGVISRRLNSTD